MIRRSRRDPVLQAKGVLKKFRQGSQLAIAMTAFLLFAVPPSDAQVEDDSAIEQASGFFRSMLDSLLAFLPKLMIASLVLLLGWLLHRGLKALLKSRLKSWQRLNAASTLVTLAVSLLTLGVALSALAGDVNALLGSIGLVGLALSWALQVPIESLTGWVLNSFRGYYRVGDRVQVGDVSGDVFHIDALTTTVWQTDSGHAGESSQPTGALVTFPNSEVLRANIVNYTADFRYVWDEIEIGVANESDLKYTIDVIRRTATALIGEQMKGPAQTYRELLRSHKLDYEVGEVPAIYVYPTDSWIQIVIRYIADVRTRRSVATRLFVEISDELAKPVHADRIFTGYPRSQVQNVTRSDAK